MAEGGSTLDRLCAVLDTAGARRVVDIGCGGGALAGALTARSLDVVGVDPQAGRIAAARRHHPAARFLTGTAEALPLPDRAQDAAVFLNALHHVPEPAMDAALDGALRALRPGGVLVIVEPLAQGSFFEAMRPVDDETEVRAHALAVVDRL